MAKIKVRPLDDRVVIRPAESEEVTAGGIVLPDSAKEKPSFVTTETVRLYFDSAFRKRRVHADGSF